jgi:dTDP-3,4-didehydro-2,6-dideoxy-alpha-D-glucose 3-reductase
VRLLILGHSQIVQRRVLPALARVPEIEQVDIASRRPLASAPPGVRGEVFAGYDAGLHASRAEIAWVSVVNSAHAELVERCLQRGLHVVVEKPACTRLADAQRLVELARRQGLCLAEATVFASHPQIAAIRQLFAQRQDAPTRLTATFSVPPFAADNFRWRRELGGGALLDMGVYAVATARLFFGEPAREVSCRVLSRRADLGNLDTAFSVLATFGGGRALVGQFGFDTEYRNHLELLGQRLSVTLDRIFTTPPDAANVLSVSAGNEPQQVSPPVGDSFALFLTDVIASIRARSHQRWADILWADANALHALRTAAGETDA